MVVSDYVYYTKLALHSYLRSLWFAQTLAWESSLISLPQVQKWYCMNYHIRYLLVVKVFILLKIDKHKMESNYWDKLQHPALGYYN